MVAAWRVARVPAEVASVRPRLPKRLPAYVLDAELSPCARLERDPPARLLATRPDQAFPKPLCEIVITHFTACDVGDGVCDYLVIFNEFIAASLDHQFHRIKGCPLVPIREPVV